MTQQNIAAYTPCGIQEPPYVSINLRDEGLVSIGVRSGGTFNEILLPKEEFAKLVEQILKTIDLWAPPGPAPVIARY